MKHKKLVCFDFDDTLFHTPKQEEGKKVWLEKTGEHWTHKGWWGKSETIDLDIFDIPLNNWVYERYLEINDAHKILATGRLDKIPGMRDCVNKILDINNIVFDEVHLNWGTDTLKFKIKLFNERIETLGVEEFIMFDDRKEHLIEFEKWAEVQNIKITIVDVINKTTKVFN